MNSISQSATTRNGCKDIWNAFMVSGAKFTEENDIPICQSIVKEIPKKLISYVEAKKIYKKQMTQNPNFFVNAYVHFYIDDQKFDGKKSSIWLYPYKALDILRHFEGVITPDFSTYADFPDSIKRYNTYRMRAFGCWLTTNGVNIINNVRWNTEETWNYCFDGIPYGSIVAIGTVASGLKKLENRKDFENGLLKMVEIIHPKTIITYGSSKYTFFDNLKNNGITIIEFQSQTNLAFNGGECK